MAANLAAKVAGKGYYADMRPAGFFRNHLQFGVKTKKVVGTNEDEYTIKRYFDFFPDYLNRADLAFAMLQLAARCKKRNVYA